MAKLKEVRLIYSQKGRGKNDKSEVGRFKGKKEVMFWLHDYRDEGQKRIFKREKRYLNEKVTLFR